ncbi:MAG TPA: hypothetical protein VL523_19460 [Terriglobia bacterium]|nr:hypothetical protein [Terriglobia bacterium]
MSIATEASRQRFRALAPVEFDAAEFLPPEIGLEEIDYLFQAAEIVDGIFWRQASPQASALDLLKLAGDDRELREMVLFNCGPYDRLQNDSPFLPVGPKLPGAGFYPPDLSREDFTAYLQNHPDCKPSFQSPYTVIQCSGSHLSAVPYYEAYSEQVTSISRLMAKASRHERHSGFREFLAQRAQDLLRDDYYASDSLWVRLTDNPLDLVIGPIEVYEDQLMGLKASYEALLLARDFAESSKVQHFQHELPSLCRTLETQTGRRLQVEESRVALSVANLVYAGGDARKAIPAIAFSLPNDERVVEDVGSRQVILRNVLEAKFRLIDWQLHQRVLAAPVDNQELAFRCFSDHTLFHELSHAIGPHRISRDGESTTVNRCLKHHYSVLEETKADTLAACLMLQTSAGAAGHAFLETYVAGFLRAIRFGLASAHGGANAIQFNFLSENGAISIHPKTARLSIDSGAARAALLRLVSSIVGIQESGDFDAADRFVGQFCRMSPGIVALTEQVKDLPIDIRIRFETERGRPSVDRLADRALAT